MSVVLSKTASLLGRAIWLMCAIAVALAYVSCGRGELAGECRLVYAGLMGILTFPVGIVWLVLSVGIGFALHSLGFDPVRFHLSSMIEIVQLVIVICLGYFQWFITLPWLWEKWKVRRK